MKLFRTITMSLALAAAASPAYADAPKAPAGDVSEADIAKFLAFWDKIVDAVVANKDDCDKMAGSINTIVDANAELLKMATEAKSKGKKLPQTAQEHMMDGVKKMAPAMQKCQSNDKVKKAFERLDMGKRGK